MSDLTQARLTELFTTVYINTTWQFVKKIQPEHSINVPETQDTKQILKSSKTIWIEIKLKARIIRETIEIEKRFDCLNKRSDSHTWNSVGYIETPTNHHLNYPPPLPENYHASVPFLHLTRGVGRLRLNPKLAMKLENGRLKPRYLITKRNVLENGFKMGTEKPNTTNAQAQLNSSFSFF